MPPPAPLPLAMPPPLREVFPLTWLTLIETLPARFWMPPPPAFGAVLLFTWLKLSVSWLVGPGEPMKFPVAMPPPEAPPAKLFDTRVKLSVALPWALTMPPPLPSKLPVPGLRCLSPGCR